MSEALDKIYSLAEASERLRLNKNALARLGRRTGHCSVTGRTVLFSEADLLALWQEMRVTPSRRVEKVTALEVARSAQSPRLQELLRRKSRK